jgi:uncharacterized protein with von Willebrand factor type A (vWA) domain
MASELAAVEYARAFARLRAENGDDAPDTPAGDREVARAAMQGAGAGADEVDTYQNAVAACSGGCGHDPARQEGKLDPQSAARIYRKVKHSATLKRIMDLAGKYRRLAQGKQRLKESHPIGDVVDLTLGGEIERMTAGELARFYLPSTTLDLYRRILQRQALVREHRDEKPAGRGPIVVLVDESRSMRGNRVDQAKGLALALAWVAREQRRWCCLLSFGVGTHTTGLTLRPGRWDEAALLDWLMSFQGAGGTDLDVLTSVVPARWDEWAKDGMGTGKSDIILITDGQMETPGNLAEFLAFKAARKARVLSIVIGNSRGTYGGVPAVSDETHEVVHLDVTSSAAAAAVSVG